MVPFCVIVHYVFGYRCAQVSLTERYEAVETLSTGLVTFYVLFAIQLKTRRVHISIPTPNPDRVFMKQVALDLAAFDDSFLRGYSHLIIDRDSKYTTEFREVLKENDVDIVPIPTKSPNCNPHTERFVR